ncbi:RNAse P Rpr2/Rpp21/SNM1 subunit domain-containing protein [Talaromyces proteolyticus]|uniref:RNAse P Rpr2/Rpp21/SNM1 subunit domain-containing protein n=1 Tax=Talaromyces proteolyticus TaxID=1131652 RepID=A0AAD4L816_9EURO|nr:RNAse P Rpr2/Rpp21/SNM1 subunit domain-containing protein [Talaromyces proteolyticus]KAH8705604.1 RNAse P Rpr2/Rpp21/SNM1 subunit domain-containing protein [Talaromyces proteolyticus]
MAVSKNKKGTSGGAQSHIRARLTYLQKAATYIYSKQQDFKPGTHTEETECENTTPKTSISTQSPCQAPEEENRDQEPATASLPNPTIRYCLPRQYISHMRGVSRKTQQRLSIETKRTFCKRCDLILIPGVTCTEEIQNASKDRKKPWADVLVIRCSGCETEKRFPQSDRRSKKLKERKQDNKESKDQTAIS